MNFSINQLEMRVMEGGGIDEDFLRIIQASKGETDNVIEITFDQVDILIDWLTKAKRSVEAPMRRSRLNCVPDPNEDVLA